MLQHLTSESLCGSSPFSDCIITMQRHKAMPFWREQAFMRRTLKSTWTLSHCLSQECTHPIGSIAGLQGCAWSTNTKPCS